MDSSNIIKETFERLGFKILHENKPKTANGVDLWVIKDGRRPMSVEIKNVRKQKTGCYQVDPVLKNRISDDLIAIVINEKYVLVEEMKHHLAACSNKGTRQFTCLVK